MAHIDSILNGDDSIDRLYEYLELEKEKFSTQESDIVNIVDTDSVSEVSVSD
jgi:hypothetical protein